MKTDRRTGACLNCNEQLDEEYKYCPHCGQKNSDNNVSVGTLLGDVFSNYFSLDSKFIKSFVPFFFKPGVLTNQFIEGKRVRFIQPVRLYVLTSLMFFFVMKSVLTRNDLDFNDVFSDSDQEEVLSEPSLIAMDFGEDDAISSTQKDTATAFLEQASSNDLYSLMRNPSISNAAVLDSLGVSVKGPLGMPMVTQARKILSKDVNVFIVFLLGNIPIMMVFVVPVLALVLKLLYIRRKKLYITHLVHAIHLHAFAYLTYGLVFCMIYFSTNALNNSGYFALIALALVGVYSLVSFFTVYRQGVLKTIVKFLVVGFMYSFLMMLFLLWESLLSILYF